MRATIAVNYDIVKPLIPLSIQAARICRQTIYGLEKDYEGKTASKFHNRDAGCT